MLKNTIPTKTVLTHEEVEFIREQGEYFDTHDMSEELANGPEVQMDFSHARSHYYFEIEPELRDKLEAIAKQRGIKSEFLLNEWAREKIAETEAVSTEAVGAAK